MRNQVGRLSPCAGGELACVQGKGCISKDLSVDLGIKTKHAEGLFF